MTPTRRPPPRRHLDHRHLDRRRRHLARRHLARRQLARHCRDQRGSAAIEAAIVAPAMLAMLLVGVAAYRYTAGSAEVHDAAQAAARAAALAGAPHTAANAGATAATNALDSSRCGTVSVSLDTSRYPQGWVQATVTCTVDLADLAPLPLPGSTQVTATYLEAVDPARLTALNP